MPSVLIPLARGFEELEAVTVIDLLRRAEIEVVTAGIESGPVTGSRGTVILPDSTLDAEQERDFDMVVLPGGMPGSAHLDADPRVHRILRRQQETGRFLAAICAAPRVLARSGLLDGLAATAYPGALDRTVYPGVRWLEDAVVVDGQVITSRGPGTAMDFALCLVEILVGAEGRDRVEGALVRAL